MFKKYVMKNGVRIILSPIKDSQAVTILIIIAVGSRYETKDINGISHLLEHEFFKGTKKRSDKALIIKELDAVGGMYNAFTGKEVMGFWVKVEKSHLRLAVDILSDMLFNSSFKASGIVKEKKVITEEINMREDDPQTLIGDLWEEILYKGESIGWPIAGTYKSLKSISRKNIIDYFKQHFTAGNIVISLAGGIEEKKDLKTIEDSFRNFKSDRTEANHSESKSQTTPIVFIRNKKTAQSHLVLGVRAFPLSHPDRYPLAVISAILGSGLSCRLFTEVREKRGLAYYIYTSLGDYTDRGYLAASAGVDNKRVGEAVKTILKEFKKLKTEKVTPKELSKAKDGIRGKMLLNLETSDQWASFTAEQEILENRIMTIRELCDRIGEVSQHDILRVAKTIFAPERLNLAAIGPDLSKKELEKILII
ncbi:MAG: pitrilysin family protein [bacterium]